MKNSTVTIDVGKDLSITVLDKGPGVPVENQEKIFSRFWSSEQKRGGAGLGLAIVQRICQAHGGSISVDGAPGGGAAFMIKLKPSSNERNIH